MLFERRCPVCGRPHRLVCGSCIDGFELAPDLEVAWVAELTPLFVYDDASAPFLLAAKNGGRRDLLRWAGGHLGSVVARRQGSAAADLTAVTWVPAHPRQRRARGYDQGQVLARVVARRLGVRAQPLLVRRSGASRRGLGRTDRLVGPEIECRRRLRGRVLLVDDVMATGTSLERSADALRSAGAERVTGAVVAASTQISSALPARR